MKKIIFSFIVSISCICSLFSQTHTGSFASPVKTFFLNDGASVITYQPDNWEVFFWNIENSQKYFDINTNWIYKCILSADKNTLFVLQSDENGKIIAINTESGIEISRTPFTKCTSNWLTANNESVVCFFKNYETAKLFESDINDKTIWQLVLNEKEGKYVQSIVFLPKKKVFIYEMKDKKGASTFYKILLQSNKPQKINISSKNWGPFYVSTNEDFILLGNGSLYDFNKDKILYTQTELNNSYEKFFFDNDSRIINFNTDGQISIYDRLTGEMTGGYNLKKENRNADFYYSGYSEDHKLLAYTHPFNTVHIVKLETGQHVASLTDGSMKPNPLAKKGKSADDIKCINWASYFPTEGTIALPQLMNIFNNSFAENDWQGLIYKYKFKYSKDAFEYFESPDKNYLLAQEKGWPYIGYVNLNINKIANLDFLGISKNASWEDLKNTFGIPYCGNWMTGININKSSFSVAMFTGRIDEEKSRFVVTLNFDNDGQKIKSVTINPYLFKSFKYQGAQSIISIGCLSGDCENGEGIYQWPNGMRFSGTFYNGSALIGNLYNSQFSTEPTLVLKEYVAEYLNIFYESIKNYEMYGNERSKDIQNIEKDKANVSEYDKDFKRHHNFCMDYLTKAADALLNVNNYLGSVKGLNCTKVQTIIAIAYNLVGEIKRVENSKMSVLAESPYKTFQTYYEIIQEIDKYLTEIDLTMVKEELIKCGYGH